MQSVPSSLTSVTASNSVNSVFTAKENVGVVLLTVLNATAEDSGEFACVASNGIGGKASRNVSFLLVRRKFIFEFLHFLQVRIITKVQLHNFKN